MQTTDLIATIDTTVGDDEAMVWRWKYRVAQTQLRFPEELAFAVANENLDIHYLDNLVVRGCPPQLALEIARP